MVINTIFKQYPFLTVYYKTDDGQAFFHESDARSHAKKLNNNQVILVKRDPSEIS